MENPCGTSTLKPLVIFLRILGIVFLFFAQFCQRYTIEFTAELTGRMLKFNRTNQAGTFQTARCTITKGVVQNVKTNTTLKHSINIFLSSFCRPVFIECLKVLCLKMITMMVVYATRNTPSANNINTDMQIDTTLTRKVTTSCNGIALTTTTATHVLVAIPGKIQESVIAIPTCRKK